MRTLACSGAVVLALAFATAPAHAQIRLEGATMIGGTWIMAKPPSQFAIRSRGASGDAIVTDGEIASNGVSYGAIFGARFGRLGAEALLQWVPLELNAPHGLESEGGVLGGDVFMYSATAVYHFRQSGTFKPFFGIGVGAQTTRFDGTAWRGETVPMANLLAGGEVELGSGIALRLDARNCISPWRSRVAGADEAVRTDAVFSAGLAFSRLFGG
jgi:outer membrane protein W